MANHRSRDSMMRERIMRMRFNGREPKRRLAASANRAVAVQEMAVIRAMVSPRYVIK